MGDGSGDLAVARAVRERCAAESDEEEEEEEEGTALSPALAIATSNTGTRRCTELSSANHTTHLQLSRNAISVFTYTQSINQNTYQTALPDHTAQGRSAQ